VCGTEIGSSALQDIERAYVTRYRVRKLQRKTKRVCYKIPSACGTARNGTRACAVQKADRVSSEIGRGGWSRWCVVYANVVCRRAQLPRTLGGGWEHSTPWFLPCSCRIRIERPTVENARRRRGTPYPLILSKARWSDGLSGRLPRILGGGRERSTPWSEARRGIKGAIDYRERSTEAENALPLGLAEGSWCSRTRSRLRIADLADRDADRRAKCSFR